MKTDDTYMSRRGHTALDDLFAQGAETGFFSRIDIHFARFVRRLTPSVNHNIVLAAALLSKYTREGHICLDLAEHAGKKIVFSQLSTGSLECPDLDAWVEDLRASSVVGMPGDYTPMVLDAANRLYLWRYWDYEQTCADKILLLSRQKKAFDPELFRKGLETVFNAEDDDGTMEQKLSALRALMSGLCVITGGPGTGKTTLVSKILSLLLHQEHSLSVALAAPTGKAAQRLGEAVSKTMLELGCPGGVSSVVPKKASTLHRLLGIMPSKSRPRYNEENLLPYDVVVIDEASMVDLALIAKLMQAVKPSARLIFLGDKNQLASVQAGHVLGDICDTGEEHGYSKQFSSAIKEMLDCDLSAGEDQGIQDSVIELKRTYRFTHESGIYQLSRCINEGDLPGCMDIIKEGDYQDIDAHEITSEDQMFLKLQTTILDAYAPYLRAAEPEECLRLFNSFRVLCALRDGPFGVSRMNELIEHVLASDKLIRPGLQHYHGRPIIITANDYTTRLFNGDVGIILGDAEEKNLRAFFLSPEGELRKISPMRLPAHETAFAMTVHKSQGSEFDHVLLLLPNRDAPVLTRELIYTGITRAMNHLDLWMDHDVFAAAVARCTQRTSGLHDLLWGRE